MHLEDLGWNADWERALAALQAPELAPARVIAEHKDSYRVATAASADWLAEVAGRFRHQATGRGDFPAVGDFVAVRLPEGNGPAIIHARLPRKTAFVRKAAGERLGEQVVAANVDTVFLMSALDHDFNLRRIERYLTLGWESGAEPVIILNKADLCPEIEARLLEVQAVAPGVPIHAISALADPGTQAVAPYLARGRTIALLGSSGVGKSTLINRLLGSEVQATREVRESDGRGRHTTTHRELFVLAGGGMIIDTPGMRELQLWSADDGLDATFADVAALAAACRYRDCQHASEPGCAVREAVERGELLPDRLASYHKLMRELRYLESQQDEGALLERKRAEKIANKAMKEFKDRR